MAQSDPYRNITHGKVRNQCIYILGYTVLTYMVIDHEYILSIIVYFTAELQMYKP